MRHVGEKDLVYLCQLAQEHGKKGDRWSVFKDSKNNSRLKLSEKEFYEVDERTAQFMRYWGYILKSLPEDLYTKSFCAAYDERSKQKKWHLLQLEHGVKPNGPKYISLLKKYMKKSTYWYDGPPPPLFGHPRGSIDLKVRKPKVDEKYEAKQRARQARQAQKAEESQRALDESNRELRNGCLQIAIPVGFVVLLIVWIFNNPREIPSDTYCNPATGVCGPADVEKRRREKLDEDYEKLQDIIN